MSLKKLAGAELIGHYRYAGGEWGDSATLERLDTLNGTPQETAASEAARYGTIGSGRNWVIYFASDPRLKAGDVLQWQQQYGENESDTVSVRVLGTKTSGRPNRKRLWSVYATDDSTHDA